MTMKKRLLAAALAAVFVFALAGAASADEPFDENEWDAVETIAQVSDIALAVPSALLMERETGTVIYELNAHERRAPASVTKVMTLLLVTEAVERGELSLDEQIAASAHAAGMGGSQIYLKENERMSADDLIKSVAVASANDAAVALAERVAGSEEAFVSRMNARAAELGMADTVFANCTGLPAESEHLTSAWDIALMSRELMGHELIRKYTCIWTDSVRGGEFGLSNTNKLVRFYDGATGLKTGFTQEAKYCLSATAMRGGVEYIAVIMGADTSDIRFESAKTLLNYAFANYALTEVSPAEPLPPIPVSLGTGDYIQPVVESEGKLLVGKSELSGIERSVELEASLEAPVPAGRRIGTLTITNAAGEVLAERAVVAPEEIPRLTWGQIFVRYLRTLCCLRSH
ncbi:MAG: D-alanyl-D-alanine carboxypeptidase [Oscillospiraceae bacterium]|nr:D-alanyl-D-alanine carboxypeptidase [Oscillospiraceae bacterium]